MTKNGPVDKFFLGIVITTLSIGVVMFISASLGVLERDRGVFYGILFNQIVLGLGLGLLGMYIASRVSYKFWRRYSFYLFLGSLILTALVFVPHLGFEHGGAKRWLSLGPFSFQPAELLKFSFIIYFASWLSFAKNKVQELKWSILPLLGFLAVIAAVLFKQPDTKSFMLIVAAAISMLFVSGLKWKYIIGIGTLITAGLLVLAFFTPYLSSRVKTFLDPASDIQGASYQVHQSLIAVGSGGVFGRGLGQSIQKFGYLPEPQGDSIFAVIGEEFGFVGGVAILVLFLAFALRGLKIASNAPDIFSRMTVLGIIMILTVQSFLNIASIVGVFPLTGVPLVFISHGGTSLMFSLIAVGIVLNISRSSRPS